MNFATGVCIFAETLQNFAPVAYYSLLDLAMFAPVARNVGQKLAILRQSPNLCLNFGISALVARQFRVDPAIFDFSIFKLVDRHFRFDLAMLALIAHHFCLEHANFLLGALHFC